MRMQVGTSRPMVLQRDRRAVGHVGRHFCLMQRIALELALKGGGIESVAAARPIQQLQMHVKEERVDGKGQNDEAEDARDQVLDHVEDGKSPVAQKIPQLLGRADADEENDEETDELGGGGGGQRGPAEGQVAPPPPTERSVGITAELEVEEGGGDDGEQERGIKQDVLGQDEKAWGREI